MNECREAFEKWATVAGYAGFLLREREYYASDSVSELWLAWQAAWNYKEKSDET